MAFPWRSDIGVSSIAQIQALARSSGVPFSVSSTYRPGDPGHHGTHNAVDMYSSVANMRKLAGYLYQYSPYLLELIHSNGPFFVKNGVRDYPYSSAIVKDHYDHVHCATTVSALKAASGGNLTIPAGSTGTNPAGGGCLPVMIGSLLTITTTLGGYLWIIH